MTYAVETAIINNGNLTIRDTSTNKTGLMKISGRNKLIENNGDFTLISGYLFSDSISMYEQSIDRLYQTAIDNKGTAEIKANA